MGVPAGPRLLFMCLLFTFVNVHVDCRRRGDLGLNPKPKHAIASCSQTINPMLPHGHGKYKRELVGLATEIPSFAKLLWSLLLLLLLLL